MLNKWKSKQGSTSAKRSSLQEHIGSIDAVSLEKNKKKVLLKQELDSETCTLDLWTNILLQNLRLKKTIHVTANWNQPDWDSPSLNQTVKE